MKVKWTTITEDESTWPPENYFVVLNYGRGSTGAYRYKNHCDEWVMVILGDDDIELKCRSIAMKWRPMPKPPKEKEPKSPWNKVSHGYPSNGMAILIKKNGVGVSRWTYRFGRKKGEGDFMPIDAVELANKADEWMEIPE